MKIDTKAIQRADKEAFAKLFKNYSAMLFRIAFSYVHDEDAAYDLVQQTFEKAMKNAHGFRGDSSPKSWLVSILINSAKNVLRANKRTVSESAMPEQFEPAPTVEVPQDAPDLFLLASEQQQMLAEAFNSLPPKQREVMRLRIEEGFSFAEIAQTMQISEGTARVNYHHAVRNMKDYIQNLQNADSMQKNEYEEV